jgi:pimeloyl-ACP methyl ester carboxylesterase
VVTETDLALGDGRTVHVYDTGTGDGTTGLAVFWHHGTPSTGVPPEPLFAAAAERGIRWVSHDRPGYGGSTPHPGRDVASVAADVARVADAVGIDRFAVMGDSGGGAHALACATALPGRVLAAVCISAPAPFGAEGRDWFAGMTPLAPRSTAPPQPDARRSRSTSRPPSSTRRYLPRPITPHSSVHGHGWAPW